MICKERFSPYDDWMDAHDILPPIMIHMFVLCNGKVLHESNVTTCYSFFLQP